MRPCSLMDAGYNQLQITGEVNWGQGKQNQSNSDKLTADATDLL